MSVEFKLIKDWVEVVPPTAAEMNRYNDMLNEYARDDYWAYAMHGPQGTQVNHSVVDTMTTMVEEGWQVHTFSVDSNGVYFALMEREKPE